MTLYLTPFGRMMRRRMWDNLPAVDESEYESDVTVPVNVELQGDDFVVTALLPGLKAEDLKIQVVNETVTLQGVLGDGADESSRFLVRERPTGRFYRVIRLPDSLDSARAEADLHDGVLVLRIPKAEEARPKTIKVVAK